MTRTFGAKKRAPAPAPPAAGRRGTMCKTRPAEPPLSLGQPLSRPSGRPGAASARRLCRASTSASSPSGTPARMRSFGPRCRSSSWSDTLSAWYGRARSGLARPTHETRASRRSGSANSPAVRSPRGCRIMSCRPGRAAPAAARSGRARVRGMSRQRALGKRPSDPVHFLGAAVARAIGGAPAARFDVVGHEVRH